MPALVGAFPPPKTIAGFGGAYGYSKRQVLFRGLGGRVGLGVLLRGLVFIIVLFYCVDWLVFLCLEVALLE